MTRRSIARCAIALAGATLFFFAAVAGDHAADASVAAVAGIGPATVRQDARCWSNRLIEACVLRPVAR